jgi:hypothetical protein
VRLQASRTTNRVSADYFTTTRRIGQPGGIALLNDARQPASRVQLADSVAGSGAVHDSAAEYRNAVRRTLYPGMDPQRYDSLIQALLQLRRPKLSERLDPSVLSTLLSNSLPPIDGDEIAALAEGFERLDKQREHLEGLDREVEAARLIAERSRLYSRRILRAAAARLTSSQASMETLARTARESGAAHEAACAEREQLLAESQQCQSELAAAGVEVAALEDSGEYRAGRELDQLRSAVLAGRQRVADAQLGHRAAEAAAQQAGDVATAAVSRLAQTQGELDLVQRRAATAATAAGMATLWQRCAEQLPAGGEHLEKLVRPAMNARV